MVVTSKIGTDSYISLPKKGYGTRFVPSLRVFYMPASQVAVSATTAVYDGLEILCALAPNTGLRLSDK